MKTVIFDMDGILVDSEVRALRAWREVAKKHGIPNIDKLFPKIIGTNTFTRGIIFNEYYGKGIVIRANKEMATIKYSEKTIQCRIEYLIKLLNQ